MSKFSYSPGAIQYTIAGQVEDTLFPTQTIFKDKPIQLWAKTAYYDEFIGETSTDGSNNFHFTFYLNGEEGPPVLFFKVFETPDKLFTHTTHVGDETVVEVIAEAGTTTVTLKIDFGFDYLQITTDSNTLFFQFVDGDGNPHINFPVNGSFYKDSEKIIDLGDTVTNGQGIISFAMHSRMSKRGLYEFYNNPLMCSLKFTIDIETDTPFVHSLPLTSIQFENTELMVIELDLPARKVLSKSSVITELLSTLTLTISSALTTYLSGENITTLRDIRLKGGLKNQAELQESEYDDDQEVIHILDSHAQLETASQNYELNHFLITEKEYTSIYSIARKQRHEFLTDTSEYSEASDLESFQMYQTAVANSTYYSNQYAALYIQSTKADPGDVLVDVEFENSCDCADCNAAVSPFAYLMDLISYSEKYLKKNYTDPEVGQENGLTFRMSDLEELFCQRFSELPIKCEELHKRICQYRIAVEVLQCYRNHPEVDPGECQTDAFVTAEKYFLHSAYYLLLEELGTTYSELRNAQNNPEKKAELVEKLGIPLDPTGSITDTIDRLYLSPKATSGAKQITSAVLEAIFGFRDYTDVAGARSPLAEVPECEVQLWKLQYLKDKWLSDDSNDDRYSHPLLPTTLPIIDPDLIGPDDLSRFDEPNPGTPPPTLVDTKAFSLWLTRRNYLDGIWNDVIHKKTGGELDYFTPPGVKLGNRKFTFADDDLTAIILPGTTIRLIKNITIGIESSYLFTVEEISFDTPDNIIVVKEAIPEEVFYSTIGTGLPTYSIQYLDKISISSLTVVSNEITLATAPDISNGDSFEIFGSIGIDGSYIVDTVASNVVEVAALPAGATSTPGGVFAYVTSTSAVTIDNDGTYFTVAGDYTLEIDDTVSLSLSGSPFNDGSYTIDSVDAGNGNTTRIFVNESVVDDTEAGIINYTKSFILNVSTPEPLEIISIDLGERSFVINGRDLSELSGAEYAGYILSDALTSVVYTLDSVDLGGDDTYFKVGEAITPSLVGANLTIEFPTSDFTLDNPTSWEITVEESVTPGLLPFSFLQPGDQIEVDGDTFTVAGVSSGVITVEDRGTALPASPASFKLLFPIGLVAITENSIVVNKNLGNDLYTDLPFEIYKVAGGSATNNGTYRVTGYTVNSSGNTIIKIKEVLVDSTVGTPPFIYGIRYKKALPIAKQRPILEDIFAEWIVIGNFSGYTNPWDFGDNPIPVSAALSSSTFVTYRNVYQLASSEDRETIRTFIAAKLHLAMDAFIQLTDLYERYQQSLQNTSNPPLTQKEYEEIFNILILAFKNTAKDTWITQETDSPALKLNYADFWISQREPKEGNLPVIFDQLQPAIDPELVSLADLPDPITGQYAAALWNERKEQLADISQRLTDTRLNYGYDAMLRMSLGALAAFEDPIESFDILLQNLNSLTSAIAKKAETTITNSLKLTEAQFRILMEFKARYNSNTPPAASEYTEVNKILTKVYKIRHLYAEWLAAEKEEFAFTEVTDDVNFRTDYWTARKMMLPQWRASAEARREWQNALISRNSQPIVDPDILQPADFVNFTNAGAYNEYATRKQEIATQWAAFGTLIAGSVNAAIVNGLNIASIDDFEILADLELAGENIAPRLAQLHLAYPAYKRLKELKDVTPLLDEEKNEIKSILTQVWKTRVKYAIWKADEDGAISLSPEFFKIPLDPYGLNEQDFYSQLPQWRATYKERRAWEKKLKARIEQRDNVYVIMKNMQDKADETVLPIIRNALVQLLGVEHAPLQDNAKKLSNRLLVDFSINCCQHTNHLSQAIETVQKLLWSESVGIDRDIELSPTNTLSLEISADNFEAEWQWMGSYATWRAAMFVFLYPENLLLPTLKRNQTPKFAELTYNIRTAARFTPDMACKAAQTYKEYVNELTNLQLQATCNAKTYLNQGPCTNQVITGEVDLFYSFAINSITRKVYYAAFNDERLNNRFWLHVEAFESDIIEIIAAVPFNISDNESYIYVFSIAVDDEAKKSLVYLRYNLTRQTWDSSRSELDLPEWTDMNCIVVKQVRSAQAPTLYVKNTEIHAIYSNQLDEKGKKWANSDWDLVAKPFSGFKLESCIDVVDGSTTHSVLFISRRGRKSMFTYINSIYYRVLGSHDNGEFVLFDYDNIDNQFVAAISHKTTGRSFHVLYKNWGLYQKELTIGSLGFTQYWGLQGLKDFMIKFFNIDPTFVPIPNEFSIVVSNELLYYTQEYGFVPVLFNYNFRYINDVSAFVNWFSTMYVAYENHANSVIKQSHTKMMNNIYRVVYQWFEAYFVENDEDDLITKESKKLRKEIFKFLAEKGNTLAAANFSATGSTDIMDFVGKTIKWTTSNAIPVVNQAIRNLTNEQSTSISFTPIVNEVVPNSSSHSIASNKYSYGILKTSLSSWIRGNFQTFTQGGRQYLNVTQGTDIRIMPYQQIPLQISEGYSSAELYARRTDVGDNTSANAGVGRDHSLIEYFKEGYYFFPFFLGMQLQQRGYYKEALEWYRSVYDFANEDETLRRIYEHLGLDSGNGNGTYDRDPDWLLDPLNPHAVAATRDNQYYQYTVTTIAGCMMAWADAEFTTDTVESISRAKDLYERAKELLSISALRLRENACNQAADETREETWCKISGPLGTDTSIYKPVIEGTFRDTVNLTATASDLQGHLDAVKDALIADFDSVDFDIDANIKDAETYIAGITPATATTVGDVYEGKDVKIVKQHEAVMTLGRVEHTTDRINTRLKEITVNTLSFITGKEPDELDDSDIEWLREEKQTFDYTEPVISKYNPLSPSFEQTLNVRAKQDPMYSFVLGSGISIPPPGQVLFCVPANPVYSWMVMSIELNLFKIRNCMNISGIKREIEPFAAATDQFSGLPTISGNGTINLPGTIRIVPSQYRYEVLMDRAKQLVNIAQQLEANFLSLLEKRDAEYYTIMKAKQDLSLSRANVKLQDLRLKVAHDGVELAKLQKERSELQVEGLDDMINQGLLDIEQKLIGMYYASASLQNAMAALSATITSLQGANAYAAFDPTAPARGVAIGIAAIISSTIEGANAFLQAGISANSMYAAQARREQEWEFEKTLAEQDVKIGSQQVKIAQDQVRVNDQEKKISELQMDHAEATVDFLSTKFTNVDLYDWMSGVMERIYSYFLQQATASAKLAAYQVAFERQEALTQFIQDDYWETPTDNAISGQGGSNVDRRGLTGSSRLLQDIYKLDQYAFDTDKRKLQISKTISLAQMSPFEFQQFRETGEINFDTLMDYFDRDFPGQYLRLIKRVKTTVIALIPPTEGIKATLTSSGISHAVVGGQVYQDVVIRRSPEMVALSGTQDATGVFDLQMQENKFLNPFEGSGVHMRWQFKMPKESNFFDYSTIADVLLTIEYTALHSYDYEQVVKRRIGNEFTGDRAFSFRNEFADQFYELNNPDESADPMKIEFDIKRFDFPANIRELGIDQLKFYFVVDDEDPTYKPFEDDTITLDVKLTQGTVVTGGVANINKNGIISTTSGGGSITNLIGYNPVGKWELKLTPVPDIKAIFQDNKVKDVLMVVTYSGELPRI